GGQQSVSLLRTQVREPGHGAQQAEGADKNVRIDLQQAPQCVGFDELPPPYRADSLAVAAPHQERPRRGAAEVGYGSGQADAAYAPFKAVYEEKDRSEVDDIDEYLKGQGNAHSLAAQQPT